MATKSISQLDTAASVSASDLYEVAIPDVQSASGYASKKESGAQIATFFHNGVQNTNLNTTNKTLVGAINEVDEDSVKWTEQNFLGAKNLLPYQYYDNSGITSANVTFTVDENGWVHCKGTSTGNAIFACSSRSVNGGMFLPNGTYIVNGCPEGGSTSTSSGSYQLGVSATIDGGAYNYCYEAGDGAEFTVNGDDFSNDGAWVSVRVICQNTVVTDSLVFKPMIRLASIADESYTPPSETNRELTLKKVSWDSANFLGAKNVIPYPYYHGQSYSHNGVDFTVGDDGTITANGRASGNARYFFAYELNLKNGTYILSDGGVGTANDYLGIVYYLKSAPSTTLYIDLTDKGEIIFTKDDTWDRATIRLWIRNNTEVSYKKYYPMLRPVSVINKEYEAQAESNRTLTLYKCSMSLIANVENSDTASNAYSIGDYMFHYGKFYKVTAAITQGGAITSGTNVTETTLGAELKAALS